MSQEPGQMIHDTRPEGVGRLSCAFGLSSRILQGVFRAEDCLWDCLDMRIAFQRVSCVWPSTAATRSGGKDAPHLWTECFSAYSPAI